ncbi:hypothetical protein Mapa_014467 [Marchantia paleacea]|nr:hypothetical protein Mapa_014467 [Marchantia paleacea]
MPVTGQNVDLRQHGGPLLGWVEWQARAQCIPHVGYGLLTSQVVHNNPCLPQHQHVLWRVYQIVHEFDEACEWSL